MAQFTYFPVALSNNSIFLNCYFLLPISFSDSIYLWLVVGHQGWISLLMNIYLNFDLYMNTILSIYEYIDLHIRTCCLLFRAMLSRSSSCICFHLCYLRVTRWRASTEKGSQVRISLTDTSSPTGEHTISRGMGATRYVLKSSNHYEIWQAVTTSFPRHLSNIEMVCVVVSCPY